MSTLAARLYRVVSTTAPCAGFEVFGVEDLSDGQLERLRDALDLITRHSPATISAARRHTDGIGIASHGAPYHDPLTRFVFVSRELLQSDDLEWVATQLVSAMVYSRLYHRRGSRFRKARITLEKQLDFARSLPTGLRIVEHLTSHWDAGLYESAAQDRGKLHFLQRHDLPDWAIRWLLRLRRLFLWYYDRRFDVS